LPFGIFWFGGFDHVKPVEPPKTIFLPSGASRASLHPSQADDPVWQAARVRIHSLDALTTRYGVTEDEECKAGDAQPDGMRA
jgi:hypothetical protein